MSSILDSVKSPGDRRHAKAHILQLSYNPGAQFSEGVFLGEPYPCDQNGPIACL